MLSANMLLNYSGNGATYSEMLYQLKGSSHRVLFQNAAGTINMVQLFNHPDIELEDIAWFQILGRCMARTHYHVESPKRLIEIKKGNGPYMENEYMSCYVELHRNDLDLSSRKFHQRKISTTNQNHLKPPSWFKWSKSHTCSFSTEIFTGRRIRKASKIYSSQTLGS